MTDIKTRLTRAINESGLTKAQIARKLGVSAEMITQYCTTKKLPRLDTFQSLCKILNISSDWILGLDEKPIALGL